MIPPKLCLYCVNFDIEDSRGMGSTWTGPYGVKGPLCKAKHFDAYDTEDIDQPGEWRELISKAMTCADYQEIEDEA
jgi:hypothetical protein